MTCLEDNQTLSPEEFDERLQSLSKADSHRLHKIALAYAARCGLDPEGLIQEAISRALEGRRHCPRHVGVVRFLSQVMRSLSSDENKAQGRKPGFLSLSSLLEDGFDPPDKSPTPEERWLVKKLWDEVCAVFHDDELAIFILEYEMAGYTVDEIRNDLGLNQTTYDSKRRFIRRRLDRHFKQEGRV